uniref:BCNT-C domain-containing protein n=1 Tax=Haptolina ericina TaxID=156174 RepID=A0A7S3EWP2_9EUKA|mmetsp:Transcript_31787/g.71812  ORF Transcript_31787/g.71812 Transcript_31787/m.71812 type:complete len:113 (+) Transcript_31787:2-340(+)
MASGGVAGVRFATDLEFKAALPPPKLPGSAPKATGLQGLLANLDGKKKMTTMQKSAHDWNAFKSKQDDETLDAMNKFAKDGYLEKQAFLLRTDQRQADVARSNRRKGMGIRD